MKRSRLKKRAPRRLSRRAEDAPYVAWVREQRCCSCSSPERCDAAHITLSKNQKGMGMKVPDPQVVPLCRFCHRCWDEHRGGYRGLSELERFAIGTRWVAETRARWGAAQTGAA